MSYNFPKFVDICDEIEQYLCYKSQQKIKIKLPVGPDIIIVNGCRKTKFSCCCFGGGGGGGGSAPCGGGGGGGGGSAPCDGGGGGSAPCGGGGGGGGAPCGGGGGGGGAPSCTVVFTDTLCFCLKCRNIASFLLNPL